MNCANSLGTIAYSYFMEERKNKIKNSCEQNTKSKEQEYKETHPHTYYKLKFIDIRNNIFDKLAEIINMVDNINTKNIDEDKLCIKRKIVDLNKSLTNIVM